MPESPGTSRPAKFKLSRALQSKALERQDADAYRQLVKDHYDGPAGWFTLISGYFTGHESLAENVFGPEAFDVRGCKRLLDAGCGNGRYLRILLKQADPDAVLTGFDLSAMMLHRAEKRLKSDRPSLLTADLTRLPYMDQSFDAIVCGWVLEHLRDPMPGLRELTRVLRPHGKLLLMTTESTFAGAVCSRFYHCRTYTRQELKEAAHKCGLTWRREFWWSKFHRLLRLGAIVVELRRENVAETNGKA